MPKTAQQEIAAARLRQRNLTIGFGLVALLGISTVILLRSVSQMRRLAQHQMAFVAGVSHELATPIAAIGSIASRRTKIAASS